MGEEDVATGRWLTFSNRCKKVVQFVGVLMSGRVID